MMDDRLRLEGTYVDSAQIPVGPRIAPIPLPGFIVMRCSTAVPRCSLHETYMRKEDRLRKIQLTWY